MTEKQSIKKVRDSRFELLRIIAMFMIVAFHLVGQLPDRIHPMTTVDTWTTIVFGSWGILGVNVFVLISCYFFFNKKMSQDTGFEMVKNIWNRKSKSIAIQTLTYIIAFTLLVPVFTGVPFSYMLRFFIVKLMNDPLFVNCYWFVSAYIGLQFALPYVRKISVSKQVFVVTNILLFLSSESSINSFITSFVQFVLIAVFFMHVLKLQRLKNFVEKYAIVGFVAVTYFIIMVSCLVDTLNHSEFIESPTGQTWGKDFCDILLNVFNHSRFSYLIVWDSVFLFFAFKKIKPFHVKWINRISTLMFGVYLFHQFPSYQLTVDTVDFLRPYFSSNTMIFIMGTFVLMGAGMAVEALRKGIVHLLKRCRHRA